MNGITFGSVAALHIVDAVVADNVMRGIEETGADGVSVGLTSMGQLRGAWGANVILRTVFIGHAQDGCPACDQKKEPYFKKGPVGWGSVNRGLVRLGITQPASWGMTVINATFINYDRLGMVAVGGFSKPDGPGYSFQGNYGGETRFNGTRWVTSSHRMRWRWNDAHIVTDVDGTFTEQPFCAGCHVIRNGLVAQTSAFPDCFYDARYDASVCKPNYHFVVLGFKTAPPCGPCSNIPVRLSHRGEEGIFVAANDATFLKHKWRPEGRFSLVSLDASTDLMSMSIVGEHDTAWHGSWHRATALWISKRRMIVEFAYNDHFDGYERLASGYEAVISEDGASLTWSKGTATTRVQHWEINQQLADAETKRSSSLISNEEYAHRVAVITRHGQAMAINGTRQLFTDVVWHRCELVPHKCATAGIRYPDLPGKKIGRQTGSYQIMGNLQYAKHRLNSCCASTLPSFLSALPA